MPFVEVNSHVQRVASLESMVLVKGFLFVAVSAITTQIREETRERVEGKQTTSRTTLALTKKEPAVPP